jgi:hypothetical protein
MSIYFLEHDLYVGMSYNYEGYLVITSHHDGSDNWFHHSYLYYEMNEAIYLHIKKYHPFDISMEEIDTELDEIETNQMEETS